MLISCPRPPSAIINSTPINDRSHRVFRYFLRVATFSVHLQKGRNSRSSCAWRRAEPSMMRLFAVKLYGIQGLIIDQNLSALV